MKKFNAIVLSIAMILCTMGTVVLAAGEIRVTNMDELTAAVLNAAAANDGTTIVLAPGEYQGLGYTDNTIRGKNINFRGEDGAIVESSGEGVYMPWVTGTVENIVFTDNGKDIIDYHYSALIFAQDTNAGYPCDLTFIDCDFITSYPGNSAIHFGGDADFYNCNFVGTDSYSAMNYCCTSGDGIVIDNCTFSGSYAFASIHLAEGKGADVVISNCDIPVGRIEFGSPKNITIENNNIDTPIALWSDNKVMLDGNTFGENAEVLANDDEAQVIILPTNEGDIEVDSNGSGEVVAAAVKNETTGAYYPSIKDALNAASTDDVFFIFGGEYDAFTVPADKNNLTIVGETDADGNNLVTIRTLEDDIETLTKGIYVQAEKATVKNLDIVSGETVVKWCCSALGATNNSVGLGHSYLNELVVENCNFKGNGSKFAIWARACDITVINSTIDGYIYGLESYNLGADQEINISGTEISDVGNAVHTVNTVAGSLVTIEDSVISAQQLYVSGEGEMVIKDSVLNNVDVVTYKTLSLVITDSALYSSTFGTYSDDSSISLNNVYADNVNEIAGAAKVYNITFSTYYPTYEDFEAKTGLAVVPEITDAIEVAFELATSDETSLTYDIVLKGINTEVINRLNSADLTFALTQDKGTNIYEIVDIADDNIAVNPVYNVADGSIIDGRYEFHFEHKDGVTNDTGSELVIAQVKFTGYGKFDFGVKSADENIVNTTTIADNIVEYYIPMDNGDEIAEGELVIDNDITDAEIAIPKRDLTINVSFPNAVKANSKDYQDMTITITGPESYIKIIDLADGIDGENLQTGADGVVYYEKTVSGELTLNSPYTVTVEGAGYRTVKYTVNMTENKTLNFWNNVRDNEKAVEVSEAGEEKYAQKVTFLAGDIVKDNEINVYDLSAVVSYFGEIDLDADNKPQYAKYDLNRDGKIDSKDVAYVLVSWGN